MVDAGLRPSKVARRVLLVHGNAPWQPNGGGVFLDQFAKLSGAECDHLAIALEGRRYEAPAEFPRHCLQLVAREPMTGLGWVQSVSQELAHTIAARTSKRRLEQQMARLAPDLRRGRYDHLVLFLNAVEVTQIGAELAALLDVPYSTMEWDLLENATVNFPAGSKPWRALAARTIALRRGASSRGVASEGMAEHYQREWGLDSVVLRQAVEAPIRAASPASRDEFVIVVAGNIYVPTEFAALLAALDRLDWSVNGRPIRIEVVGLMMDWSAPLPPSVRVTGWVTHENAQKLIAGADLGYVGYWFAPESRRLVETCFPSKFIAYIGAGVPVFYHGPFSGSPARFLRSHPAGFVCDSLDPAVITERLVAVLGSPEALRRAREVAREVAVGEFGADTLSERLRGFLTAPLP